jgi:hypothetical protein
VYAWRDGPQCCQLISIWQALGNGNMCVLVASSPDIPLERHMGTLLPALATEEGLVAPAMPRPRGVGSRGGSCDVATWSPTSMTFLAVRTGISSLAAVMGERPVGWPQPWPGSRWQGRGPRAKQSVARGLRRSQSGRSGACCSWPWGSCAAHHRPTAATGDIPVQTAGTVS